MRNAKPGQHVRKYFRKGDYHNLQIMRRLPSGMCTIKILPGGTNHGSLPPYEYWIHESNFVALKPKPIRVKISSTTVLRCPMRSVGALRLLIDSSDWNGSLLRSIYGKKFSVILKEIRE